MTLLIYAGNDKEWTGQVTVDGVPLDLTGLLAATFMVKADVNDADGAALITKTLGAGLSIVAPPTQGIVKLNLTAADTVLRPGQSVCCSLMLKDAAGYSHTVYSDGFSIVRSAVRTAI